MKKRFLHMLIFIAVISYCKAQTSEALYICYNKDMFVTQNKVIANDYDEIKLSFSIVSSDIKVNTYNFKIDNIKNFNPVPFRKLNDSISKEQIKSIKLNELEDFSKYEPCFLHILLSNSSEIFLIKQKDGIFYKYKLIYWSTQRGWEPSRTD